MEATQQKIQLRQQYWVTKASKAKLLQVGAKCVDTVPHKEHYYDTALDELAMAQLWLSQRNQQWCLIVGSQDQATRENTAICASVFSAELLHQDRTDIQNSKSTIYKNSEEKKPTQLEPLDSQSDRQYYLNKTQAYVKPTSTYNELMGEHDIITYLTDFLHIDLTTEEERNMTMEDFLRQAGIFHYASNLTAYQSTYKLCDRYTIIIKMEDSSLKESATVLLDVDISSICTGFEEIENLANYLEFEHQAIQSE
ncbi:uncharacterized protein LOC132580445 [Heteronotia binoei]|uniref:uncharacterized protein LOC132580445 n=1 Tax=Heteronotia binoei TaxID=13085 RepID=UPI00292ED244|nr:uncharacterized protein LOC132580445 [Heteronotia binoei]XP_060107235.1 uncharacterized protein LOC132580445 [Heteronotia binoei]